ncbi:TIGR02391 family protein [Xylanimonas sp. McL0601]|uniref:TIGR02391 family protein n=1 Tax=Xylanimonas sp. McL0601 TaxID=3414739 RepID=UPI003CF7608D
MLDPIANWFTMSNPKALFSPRDIPATAATVKRRLDGLLLETQASANSEVPPFSPARMHPVVWTAAATHWTTHQYRVAVREAAEALNVEWKTRLGRHDVDDTSFWQQTLSGFAP